VFPDRLKRRVVDVMLEDLGPWPEENERPS